MRGHPRLLACTNCDDEQQHGKDQDRGSPVRRADHFNRNGKISGVGSQGLDLRADRPAPSATAGSEAQPTFAGRMADE